MTDMADELAIFYKAALPQNMFRVKQKKKGANKKPAMMKPTKFLWPHQKNYQA